mmetsp:Transcript_28462/g.30632  ORF Transcript_28462/g.30632 Transcript_28462/m.30632 type:complete len:130 (-) Transcript_28462:454-843(-)
MVIVVVVPTAVQGMEVSTTTTTTTSISTERLTLLLCHRHIIVSSFQFLSLSLSVPVVPIPSGTADSQVRTNFSSLFQTQCIIESVFSCILVFNNTNQMVSHTKNQATRNTQQAKEPCEGRGSCLFDSSS